MTHSAPAWRRPARATRICSLWQAALVAVLGLLLGLTLPAAEAVQAALPADAPTSQRFPATYRCDGDPLTADLMRGAVDDPGIPDPSDAPVPVGGSVVLRWRDQSLQLPRTNNAGAASFTDGRWWWSLEDPAHPRFRLRRAFGDVRDFQCEPA